MNNNSNTIGSLRKTFRKRNTHTHTHLIRYFVIAINRTIVRKTKMFLRIILFNECRSQALSTFPPIRRGRRSAVGCGRTRRTVNTRRRHSLRVCVRHRVWKETEANWWCCLFCLNTFLLCLKKQGPPRRMEQSGTRHSLTQPANSY